jgi:hypothetical protein
MGQKNNIRQLYSMYKITLLFKSDVKGIFTKEVETASNYSLMNMKRERMIKRWLSILCPNIDEAKVSNLSTDCKLQLIQNQIKMLNKTNKGEQERKFIINIKEVIPKTVMKVFLYTDEDLKNI